MNISPSVEFVRILLVEDNPGDVRLIREVLSDGHVINELSVVGDGEQAMAYLRHEAGFEQARRPHLVLLDLNLPRRSGIEVLQEMKADADLREIPVVILTSSRAERDITASYDLHANCYITKPVDIEQFLECVRSVEHFWFSIVTLPKR